MNHPTIMNQPLKTLIALLLFLPQLTQAQKAKIVLGIECGMNYSYFLGKLRSGNSTYKRHPHSGGSLGIMIQLNSQKHFSLRTGISFEQISFTSTKSYSDYLLGSTSNSRGTHTFDYITVPILARFTYGEKVNFFFNAGIFVGYLNKQITRIEGSSSYVVGGESHYSTFSESTNYTYTYKRINLGLIGGIGIGVPVKKNWHFSLEARENVGVLDIRAESNISKTPTITNHLSLLLGVAYTLGFHHEEGSSMKVH